MILYWPRSLMRAALFACSIAVSLHGAAQTWPAKPVTLIVPYSVGTTPESLGRALAQILVLAVVLEAFLLLSPFFMQWVVDDVLVSGDRDLLVTLGVGFGLLVLVQTATAAARSWAVLVLSASLNLQWLLNVFAHLLRLHDRDGARLAERRAEGVRHHGAQR